MGSLTLMMLRWAWGMISGAVKPSRLREAFTREAVPGWLIGLGALVLLCTLLVWQPFKRAEPKGLMTVKECGANLAQMRSETFEKATAKQKEIMRAADIVREAEAERARKAETRAAELEALLAAAEARGELGLPADVIRKWNKGGKL